MRGEDVRKTDHVDQFGDKVELVWSCPEEGQ